MLNTIEAIKSKKLIAILRNVPKGKILKTAQALYDGGVRLIEVAFNQANEDTISETAQLIKELNKEFSDRMIIGAGTVMNLRQLQMALESGAKYMISPHTDMELIRETVKRGAVSIPGALSPSEIIQAYQAGAHFVKLFPAGELGIDYIKAVGAPISHIPLLAVGGVNEINLTEFLEAGIAGLGIGSNMVDQTLIANNQFDALALHVKRYAEQIKEGSE